MEAKPASLDNITISEFDYELPEERIAQYPAKNRDDSKLLIFDGETISSDIFKNLDRYIPKGSLLVFNDTKVIKARLLFRKPSGAVIEVFCLEPLAPGVYEESFASGSPVEWKCIIGNLKKWKWGKLTLKFTHKNKEHLLCAEKIESEGETWRIRFSWDDDGLSFSEVIEASGHVPLPPYIGREDIKEDRDRYQTIYSAVKGSVAAPTAGLHFTDEVISRLKTKGTKSEYITLHVGAGTFQPVRTNEISGHEMHCEHFFVTKDTVSQLIEYQGNIIPVGTTSVRTIESLYWLGVKIIASRGIGNTDLKVEQWDPYDSDSGITATESLLAIEKLMADNRVSVIEASTRLIIIPGYKFRLTNGIITNFHQPRSTLLLLVSAWTGSAWKEIYKYAIENRFRFLSYGDSSLLFSSLVKK